MSEKFAIMSLSVKPEMQELLKTSGKKMGISVSQIVRTLVDKYLGLIVNDGSEIPVIFKVPADLKGKPEELKAWFATRTDAVVKKLSDVPPSQPS